MASQGSNSARLAIQAVLGIVIVVLAYLLYRAINDPWAEYQAEQRLTIETRARMDDVRLALIAFRDNENRYPGSLDSLVQYLRTDSAFVGRNLDSMFTAGEDVVAEVPPVNIDSLPFSPRNGQPFEYQIVRDDSTGEHVLYYLKDPGSEDHIGSTDPEPTMRNAASWE